MRKVEKFKLKDEAKIELPTGAKVLSVGYDEYDYFCLWAEIDTEASETEYRIFRRIRENGRIPKMGVFVGVIHGKEIHHVFEELPFPD